MDINCINIIMKYLEDNYNFTTFFDFVLEDSLPSQDDNFAVALEKTQEFNHRFHANTTWTIDIYIDYKIDVNNYHMNVVKELNKFIKDTFDILPKITTIKEETNYDYNKTTIELNASIFNDNLV